MLDITEEVNYYI